MHHLFKFDAVYLWVRERLVAQFADEIVPHDDDGGKCTSDEVGSDCAGDRLCDHDEIEA